jgi:hypothetical protein
MDLLGAILAPSLRPGGLIIASETPGISFEQRLGVRLALHALFSVTPEAGATKHLDQLALGPRVSSQARLL